MNSRQIRDLNHAARKAGKIATPKENKSLPGKQHKEGPSQIKNQPKTSRLLKFLGTGFLAILAIVGAAYQFRPEVFVDRDISLNVRDPFATQFRVTNSGLLAIYNVHFSCTINNMNFQNVTIGDFGSQAPVPVLESRESSTKDCGITADSYSDLSELFFNVSFRPSLYWEHLQKRTRFVNMRDSEGRLQWIKQSSK